MTGLRRTKIKNDEIDTCPYCGRIGLIQVRNEKIYVLHSHFAGLRDSPDLRLKPRLEVVEDECPKEGQAVLRIPKEPSSDPLI